MDRRQFVGALAGVAAAAAVPEKMVRTSFDIFDYDMLSRSDCVSHGGEMQFPEATEDWGEIVATLVFK